MKTLLFILAFIAFTQIVPAQSHYMVTHQTIFVNETVADKAINVTIDSSAWRKLSWYDERTGAWFYTDSMFVYTRARQSADSITFYVCVDFLPYQDTAGIFKGHQNGIPWYRYTVDSVKSASTYTNANQFQQWRVAKVQLGAPTLTSLTGLAGFGWYRIVTTSTRAPGPTASLLLAGNSTCASGGALQPRYWINTALVGRGGK